MVLFVLARDLSESQFRECVRALDVASDTSSGADNAEAYWSAIDRRRGGNTRWDLLCPPVSEPFASVERSHLFEESQQTVQRVSQVRGYREWHLDHLSVTMDLFNPNNELGLRYAAAGEPVVALLLHQRRRGHLVDQLAGDDRMFRVVRQLAEVLRASVVVGTKSMAPYVNAGSMTTPWEYMFPLHLLKKPRHLSDRERLAAGRDWTSTNDSLLLLWPILQSPQFRNAPMSRWFGRVEVWDENNVMVLVSQGLDGVIRPEYRDAARALGMTSIVELIPGAYD